MHASHVAKTAFTLERNTTQDNAMRRVLSCVSVLERQKKLIIITKLKKNQSPIRTYNLPTHNKTSYYWYLTQTR